MPLKMNTHDLVTLGVMATGVIVVGGSACGLVDVQSSVILLGSATTLGGYLFKQVCQVCPALAYAKERGYQSDGYEKEVC